MGKGLLDAVFMGAQNGGRFVGSAAILNQRYWSLEITLTARVAPVDFTFARSRFVGLRDGPMMGCSAFFRDPAIGFTCYLVLHVYLICICRRNYLATFQGPNSSHALVSRRHWSVEANAGDNVAHISYTCSNPENLITTLYKSTPHHTKRVHVMLSKACFRHKPVVSKPFLDPAPAMMPIYFPFGRQTQLAGNHRFFPFFPRKCMDPFVVDFSASYVWFTTDVCSWSCQATPWLQACLLAPI